MYGAIYLHNYLRVVYIEHFRGIPSIFSSWNVLYTPWFFSCL